MTASNNTTSVRISVPDDLNAKIEAYQHVYHQARGKGHYISKANVVLRWMKIGMPALEKEIENLIKTTEIQ
jgi:hypothetical protein